MIADEPNRASDVSKIFEIRGNGEVEVALSSKRQKL
jgi:hypothetical protein